jgi:hypothetical protein
MAPGRDVKLKLDRLQDFGHRPVERPPWRREGIVDVEQ